MAEGNPLRVDVLPSTMLDLARYPAVALSALLNMKKQDPVTAMINKETIKTHLEDFLETFWLQSCYNINRYTNGIKTVPPCVQ